MEEQRDKQTHRSSPTEEVERGIKYRAGGRRKRSVKNQIKGKKGDRSEGEEVEGVMLRDVGAM